MPNQIAKFQKYVALLDEVYKNASTSQILDGDTTLVQAGTNANEIVIPKISMDGLGDYSRNGGYASGNVTMTNETVSFNYDRGRKFSVDAMDNEETAGLAFGKLSSEFLRTKAVPEVDAFRYATYAGTTGISKVSAGATLSTGEAVINALIVAQNQMDEDEVPAESRVLFITPTLLRLAQNVDTTKSRDVLAEFSAIVKVPQTRFYTAITLADGKTDDELAGGYAKATAGKDINFMIIEKSAVLQYPKHKVNKAISPEDNQNDDSWLFFFREYGLADVEENKVSGIYLHHKA
jgi:hypothetical protein